MEKKIVGMDEYQAAARSTAIYPSIGSNYVYPVLGLSGEAGEVAEKFKKLIRDKDGVVTPEFQEEIKKELGDVLWYVANVAAEVGLSMSDIADTNIQKLLSRQQRGVLQGNGDNR
jgi:NTP pyrophosphatase (non-canonical NTP hydrolase)